MLIYYLYRNILLGLIRFSSPRGVAIWLLQWVPNPMLGQGQQPACCLGNSCHESIVRHLVSGQWAVLVNKPVPITTGPLRWQDIEEECLAVRIPLSVCGGRYSGEGKGGGRPGGAKLGRVGQPTGRIRPRRGKGGGRGCHWTIVPLLSINSWCSST